ncbi:hypothetical protein Patl1_21343 [Pistacia atlantica]|uniref:Uncharacterized protein n=1 Tax=Pistacia atlantica TaxID=434234 RepID=A0ACC1BLI9_9ROSI|nr:hypothetical protein Patl1_21343 [Pistacia atlantica]
MSYSLQKVHEQTCQHVPCSCPFSHCNFISTSTKLYQHFSEKHQNSAVHFMYNRVLNIVLNVDNKFIVLQEEKYGDLFILNNMIERRGNVISVTYIAPPARKESLVYDLMARSGGITRRFQSLAKTIQKRDDNIPALEESLLVEGPFPNGSVSWTVSDPDVLDCLVCYELLTIPLFQGNESDGKKEGKDAAARFTTSPYYLSTSDNLGNIIAQVQLKGDNYDEWARAMRTALHAKKKFGFIDGTVKPPPEDSLEQEDWWTVNSMLVSWILNTIEPTSRSTITYMEIAKELWNDIKKRFSVGNGPRIQQLKTELAGCKQQGMAVVSYYGKLKMIWEELGNYEQNPMCRCGGCKCNIGTELDKRREEEKLHQFLMGLDDSTYGTMRSNILSTKPESSICYDCSRGASSSHDSRKGTTSKTGHNADSCFQLVGYPDWWGNRPRGSGMGRGLGGLKQSFSWEVRGTWWSTGLSSEQWNQLLHLLNKQKEGNQGRLNGEYKIVDWIIDTGASHHMAGSLESMSNVKSILACPVGLPDGKETMAEKEGRNRCCIST